MVARTLPQAHCPHCGSSLARVEFPAIHLDRCQKARQVADAHQVPFGLVIRPPRRSLWQRLVGWLGTTTRGAAE